MGFKKRRAPQAEAVAAGPFHHASGYLDLAGVIADHTLSASQESAPSAPKGYRARSVAKAAPRS